MKRKVLIVWTLCLSFSFCLFSAAKADSQKTTASKDSKSTSNSTSTPIHLSKENHQALVGTKSGDSGYITLPSGNKIEMIWCEPGQFTMGAKDCELEDATDYIFWKPGDDKYYNQDEIPRHSVSITQGFWMGKFPISQSQYQEIMGTAPSEKKDNPDRDAVTNVSWNDAKRFCERMNELTWLKCRLPTEAEWEYAARAGTSTIYWWGDKYDSDLAFKTNPWGFEQMKGLWHWCLDSYANDFYGKSPKSDPVCEYYTIGESGNKKHVIRGGLDTDGNAARSATRSSQSKTFGWSNGTFRIVVGSTHQNKVKQADQQKTDSAEIIKPQNNSIKTSSRDERKNVEDDVLDDMDEVEANKSTGFHEQALQFRQMAKQAREQAKLLKQQISLYQAQEAMLGMQFPSLMGAMPYDTDQMLMQNVELFEDAADEFDRLDEEEKRFFNDMKNAKSRKERTELFVLAKNRLQTLRSLDTETAMKAYNTMRRAIMTFRRSIDPVQKAEEWVRIQDEFFTSYSIRQMNTVFPQDFFTSPAIDGSSVKPKTIDQSQARCPRCGEEYDYRSWPSGLCPKCSAPNYTF